jgi:4-hydroxymandelate oxidase
MIVNLHDFEAIARERLPAQAFEYYWGGANDEVTLRENRSAFDRIAIRYRVLVDVSTRTHDTTVLGTPISFPALIAPTAMQRMAHPEGEVATARAAERSGTIMVVSTTATTALADVRAAAGGPMWFQLYVYKDRGATRALLERVAEVGYGAVVLTADAPLLGKRERDIRNAFALPPGLVIANAQIVGEEHVPPAPGESGLARHLHAVHDASLTPADIEWVAGVTGLPVLVKGVVRGDDAVRAIDHGARGIVVSNHGGRQLDTAIASIAALPDVVDSVAGRAEVLLDGGVRRGTDVLKAIALGARAVLLGRPIIWGLAAGGEDGVADVLRLLREELDLAMALSGCRTISEITRDLVA